MIIIYGLFGTIILGYVVGIFLRQNLRTEITINTSPTIVWNHLVDFENYPKWNPFIKKISGDLSVGSQLAVTIQSSRKDPMDFSPNILIVRQGEELRWLGKVLIPKLFDGEHYFILREKLDGNTLLIQGENFSGILAWLLWSSIKQDTKKGFEAMNAAIKTLSETGE